MADTSGNYYGGGGGGGHHHHGGSGGGGGGGNKPFHNNNPAASSSNDQGKIFVGGLSWQTTEESLRWHFEQYGPVLSVEVMRDRNTGQPRGFAFVVFSDAGTVDLVMQEDKHEINHKIVDVKRAQARGVAPPSIHENNNNNNNKSRQQQHGNNNASSYSSNNNNNSGADGDPSTNSRNNNNYSRANDGGGGGDGKNHADNNNNEPSPESLHNKVFVGGIPPHIDRDELRRIFEEFGPVVDAIVMMDQATMRSRCFGFVTFANGSSGAQRAIEKQPLHVSGRNVEVKLATPRAEQKRVIPAGPKHVGLRAGKSSSTSSGEYAGLAVAYGRDGWKAGYGSRAFGPAGWAVQGWEDSSMSAAQQKYNSGRPCGFSFDMLKGIQQTTTTPTAADEPPPKRSRY